MITDFNYQSYRYYYYIYYGTIIILSLLLLLLLSLVFLHFRCIFDVFAILFYIFAQIKCF